MRKDTFLAHIQALTDKRDTFSYFVDFFSFYFFDSASFLHLLKAFSYSETMLLKSDHDEINVSDFTHFIICLSQFKVPVQDVRLLFSTIAPKTHSPITKLLTPLEKQPYDTVEEILSFLDLTAIARVSTTATGFYHHLTQARFWQERLVQAGCDNDLLVTVINTASIKNYKNLYRAFTRKPTHDKTVICMEWQLLCLSGDPTALDFAVKHYHISAMTRDRSGRTPMHFSALSGVQAQVDKAVSLGFALDDYDHYGRDSTHFSAGSGVPAQIDKVIKLGLSPRTQDYNARDSMHYAAWSGVSVQFDKAVHVGLDPYRKDNSFCDAGHYAGKSGALHQLSKASRYGLDLKRPDSCNHHAFWHLKNLSSLKRPISVPTQLNTVVEEKEERRNSIG